MPTNLRLINPVRPKVVWAGLVCLALAGCGSNRSTVPPPLDSTPAFQTTAVTCANATSAQHHQMVADGDCISAADLARLSGATTKIDRRHRAAVRDRVLKRNREDAAAAVQAAKIKARGSRYDRYVRLLVQRHAIGVTGARLRLDLGAPVHTQDIGGLIYWYYQPSDTSGTLVQVQIVDGRVAAINRY